MVAAGLVAKRAVERGLATKPWVKTSLAPGSRVVMDYLDRAGLTEPLARHRLRPGRIRLHHLHRELRTTAARRVRGSQRGRPVGGLGALGEPQLRRSHPPRGPDELPGLAAAGGGLRAGRHHGHRSDHRPAGRGQSNGRAGHPGRPVAHAPKTSPRPSRTSLTSEMFRRRYAAVFDGDERWQAVTTATGDTFEWDENSSYVLRPAFLEGLTMTAAPVTEVVGARVLAKLGDSVTTDHISPAGNISPSTPAGPLPVRTRCRTGRLQLLRGPSRQPRGDGTGHLRQRAAAQPVGPGHRRRVHPPPSRRRGDHHLRRRRAVRRRRDPAGDPGRQGVRIRLLPRLGGQRHRPPRGAGHHRRELRAHPPVQPHRHGGPPAPVRRRAGRGIVGTDRSRDLHHHRTRSPQRRGDTQVGGHPGRGRQTGGSSSRPGCGSTRRWRPSTTGTAASSPTCCARWPADPADPYRPGRPSRPAAGRTRR